MTPSVNNVFGTFLSEQGILHQTSCRDTPRNGMAERKNWHILEVVRALMFTINVSKFWWSEAIMTTTYLINRTSSRILGRKSSSELLLGKNSFLVSSKLFGCVCFVRDHMPSMDYVGSTGCQVYLYWVFLWATRLQVLESKGADYLCKYQDNLHFIFITPFKSYT